MPLNKIGAFAEFAAIDQHAIAKVPEYLSDEEAACVPLTALTAQQAFELMKPKSGETIFISGGTGGLGAMAIPAASSYLCAVCRTENSLHAAGCPPSSVCYSRWPVENMIR